MPDPGSFPRREDVVGTRISCTSYAETLEIIRRPREDRATVVAVCNVHSVVSARRDDGLHQAIESADLATPDGMPLVWALRLLYEPRQERVYGPTIMRRVFAEGGPGLRHFLYGSSPQTLDALTQRLRSVHPDCVIAGSISPPFRAIEDTEIEVHITTIRASGANVVWVGMGMPKQEYWMFRVAEQLPGVTLLGVGAAFDLLAGNVRQAPEWAQRAGLEWMVRLAQEPARLWRRYLTTNPAFAALLIRQVLSTWFTRSRSWPT